MQVLWTPSDHPGAAVVAGVIPLTTIISCFYRRHDGRLTCFSNGTGPIDIAHIQAERHSNLAQNEHWPYLLTETRITMCRKYQHSASAARPSTWYPGWKYVGYQGIGCNYDEERFRLLMNIPSTQRSFWLMMYTNPRHATQPEAITKISLSSWTQRLWTPWEGFFAKSV